MRAIGREMGMTPSALYRYFPSRDDLMSTLTVDGFTSLAEEMEATQVRFARAAPCDQWVALATTHRTWALAHTSEYQLLYRTDPEKNPPAAMEAYMRVVNPLFQCMEALIAAGKLDVEAAKPLVSRSLSKQFQEFAVATGRDLPPVALALCMHAWIQLHGFINLELAHQMIPVDYDQFFERNMREIISRFTL
jgi:AcrR family transcriptional regulator